MHVADLLRPATVGSRRLLSLAAGGLIVTVSLGAVTAAASATAADRPAAPAVAVPRQVRPALRRAVTNLTGTPVAVSTLSASDAWAVEGSNLVLHWNGTSWIHTALPEYGTGSYLDAVDAVSATDVWAVGYYDTASSQCQTLLERWNGTTWTRVPSPASTRPAEAATAPAGPAQLALTGTFLQGVSGTSASSAWAVGYDVVASPPVYSVSVILRWNGTNWARVPSPDPGGGTNVYLNAVTSLSPTDAWAVGYDTTAAGGTQPLVAHWNGTRWTLVTAPNPAKGGFLDLDGVSAASPSDVWAVGTYGNQKTLALHWNGTSWAQVATPSPGYTGNALSAVAAVSPSAAWAAGSYEVFRQTGTFLTKTLLLRWNGTHWTQVATPNPGATVSTLNGVAASSASDAWAVGFYQLPPSGGTTTSKTLMLRWNGAAWIRS
jgi:hypothetical protein